MRRELLPMLIVVVLLGGCAWKTALDEASATRGAGRQEIRDPRRKADDARYNASQAQKLASARRLLGENRLAAAGEILSELCSAGAVPGVTDEALFRLAILNLGSSQTKGDTAQAQSLLERLQKEYPASPWRCHAASLSELITAQNRRIRSLRGENISLTRENRELRLNMEKLKILDMEQELSKR